MLFFLLLMGCHLVVKRSNPSQPERNHLAPTPNRHFPVLNSSYSGYKKDNVQQISQIPVFQSTLRNSHKWQWDWQVEEEVPGFQLHFHQPGYNANAVHVSWAPVSHSFFCAFGLKTLGDGEQQGRDKIVTLVLKILRKFLVENE